MYLLSDTEIVEDAPEISSVTLIRVRKITCACCAAEYVKFSAASMSSKFMKHVQCVDNQTLCNAF